MPRIKTEAQRIAQRARNLEYMRRWRASEDGKRYVKAYREKYLKTPEGLATRRAYAKAHHNPQRQRTAALRRTYGLTQDDYERMLAEQGSCCVICGREPQEERNQKLHIDHNHQTGEVRGLLCQRCNQGLGNFRDSPLYLERAIKYLKETR